jgi:hypothetical protein
MTPWCDDLVRFWGAVTRPYGPGLLSWPDSNLPICSCAPGSMSTASSLPACASFLAAHACCQPLRHPPQPPRPTGCPSDRRPILDSRKPRRYSPLESQGLLPKVVVPAFEGVSGCLEAFAQPCTHVAASPCVLPRGDCLEVHSCAGRQGC